MILNVAMRVRANATAFQPHFPSYDTGKAVLEVDLMLSYGFDFSSQQDDTGLKALKDIVIVKGLFVPDSCFVNDHWTNLKSLFVVDTNGTISSYRCQDHDQAILANSLRQEQLTIGVLGGVQFLLNSELLFDTLAACLAHLSTQVGIFQELRESDS